MKAGTAQPITGTTTAAIHRTSATVGASSLNRAIDPKNVRKPSQMKPNWFSSSGSDGG
jgi:hypothetical protein